MLSLVEIGALVLEKIFKFRQYIFAIFVIGVALHLNNIGCFVPSLVEIGPVVLEKKMKM